MKLTSLILLCFLANVSLRAQEAKFQAMFVYNFTRILQWPESAQKGDFVIGVYGDSEILKELKSFTQDKKVRGEQKITVQKVTLNDVGTCHIVIVTKSKTGELSQIVEQSSGKFDLIICENPGKTPDGAAICFSKDESGIVIYEYNEKNIKKQNIGVSTSFRESGVAK